jgi:hypothetical protein
MKEYRRGVVNGVWQKLWHFHPACPNYPEGAFALESAKPSDDDLCSHCDSLFARERARS